MSEDKDVEKVVDVNEMYGYDSEQQQQQKPDGKSEMLKAFLQHLDNRKKMYLKKVD
jgi:hypothetical protein